MIRPTATSLAVLALAASVLVAAGCASDEATRRGATETARQERYAGVHEAPAADDGARAPAPEMKVDAELGVLDPAVVEETLQGHFEDVRACYDRAGKAQGYAGGRVLLRFLVEGTGHVEDVWVVESSLGNYSVERCLVDVGRGVLFEAPAGGKATTFDYPVEFRSTNQMAVLDIDGLKIDRDVAAFLPQLAACGRLAKEAVDAIMYIEPDGSPGSVGLASTAALDEGAGQCVVETIRRWKMSATLPGRVLRASFSIPTVMASAEPSPHAVSSASARRRRK